MRLLPFLIPGLLLAAPPSETLREFRAPSGLRVLLDEHHERPLVRLELQVAWDEREVPEGRECAIGSMGAALERCGAGGFSHTAFERALADRGLKLYREGGRRFMAWSMLADSQDQEDAFAFLAHAVFRPDLPEGVAAILQESKRVITPEDAFRSALGFPIEGVLSCDLDLSGILALHRRLVRPERAVLVVQGDLNLLQTRQLVMLHLGTWTPGLEPSTQIQKAPSDPPLRRTIPGEGRVAWAGAPAPEGDARSRAAQVLLALLLERAFREGIGGISVEAPRPHGDAGPILFRADTFPAGDPERQLRERLEILGRRGFTAAELEGARRQWHVERITLGLHPEEQLAILASRYLMGDPGAFLEDVRLEDVNAALRARISLQTLHWLVQTGAEGLGK